MRTWRQTTGPKVSNKSLRELMMFTQGGLSVKPTTPWCQSIYLSRKDADESVDATAESLEIPCTILPRLHWEGACASPEEKSMNKATDPSNVGGCPGAWLCCLGGQDPEWNKEAIEAIAKEFHDAHALHPKQGIPGGFNSL
eukprot:1106506-Amphidinium_carterae.2